MVKFEELIKSLILPLVAYPQDVEIIRLNDSEDDLQYQVKVNPSDLGRVIGKGGTIAKAIRTIARSIAIRNNTKVMVEID